MWSRAIEAVAEARVSTRRIAEFLLLPEAPLRKWGGGLAPMSAQAPTAKPSTVANGHLHSSSSSASLSASSTAPSAAAAAASSSAAVHAGDTEQQVNGAVVQSAAAQQSHAQPAECAEITDVLLRVESASFSWEALALVHTTQVSIILGSSVCHMGVTTSHVTDVSVQILTVRKRRSSVCTCYGAMLCSTMSLLFATLYYVLCCTLVEHIQRQ